MAGEEHGAIGRRVVGAMVIELLAAMVTALDDLEIGGKQRAGAAMRAQAGAAEPDGAPNVAPARRMGGGGGIRSRSRHATKLSKRRLSESPPCAAASG